MTENAFYPLFLLARSSSCSTLERPTPGRQVLLLALCGLALRDPGTGGRASSPRCSSRRFCTAGSSATSARGSAGTRRSTASRQVSPCSRSSGRSPAAARRSTLLGAYRAARTAATRSSGVLHYTLWHVAELDLYVGVIPFAALLALWFAPRSASPAARAFAAATLPLAVFFVVEVATFASMQSLRIEERNKFYVAPLVLIALLALAGDGVIGRGRRPLIAAALVAGVLPVAIPFARFIGPTAVSDTFALLPWWWVQDHGIHFGPLGSWHSAAVSSLRRRSSSSRDSSRSASRRSLRSTSSVRRSSSRTGATASTRRPSAASGPGSGCRTPNWIDRATGAARRTWRSSGTTPARRGRSGTNEFFNRSVGTVYTVDGPDAADGGLPETPVRERPDGTLVTATGRPPHVAVRRLVHRHRRQAGRPRPTDRLVLYRVDGPLVVLTRVTGLYPPTRGRDATSPTAASTARAGTWRCGWGRTSTSSRRRRS